MLLHDAQMFAFFNGSTRTHCYFEIFLRIKGVETVRQTRMFQQTTLCEIYRENNRYKSTMLIQHVLEMNCVDTYPFKQCTNFFIIIMTKGNI